MLTFEKPISVLAASCNSTETGIYSWSTIDGHILEGAITKNVDVTEPTKTTISNQCLKAIY